MIIRTTISILLALGLGRASAGAQEKPRLLPELRTGFAATPEAARFQSLCETVRIEGLDQIRLSDMERRLVCGDPTEDAIGLPWRRIPPNQAAYFLRGFFQMQGLYGPKFYQDGDVLFVVPGPVTRLTNLSLLGGPPTWDPPKKRHVHDEKLTPRLLNSLEGWALSQIRNEGHACATTKGIADPVTGETIIRIDAGPAYKILGIEDRGDQGLREGVLDRYNAFRVGDLYREYLITLTRHRVTDDGILESIILTEECESAGVKIIREVSLGPSRTIRLGVGASNDEGARFRAIIRRNRIGESASSAQARVNLSYLNKTINRQIADANYKWYYAPGEARSFVEPGVAYEHASESAFESQTLEARVMHGWNMELESGQAEFRVGPGYLNTHTERGTGPGRASMFLLESLVRWTSHEFEYFTTSPRSGENIIASLLLTQKRWGADFTAQKVQVGGEKLWTIFRYDPPLLILGWRFDVSSLLSLDANVVSDVPARFLTFIGGDNDLRGFDRGSLPRSGVGALSGASTGGEARFHKVIFRRVDVLTFLDVGVLGEANFKYKDPIFLSPGTGFRWESPVGVFRAYVAQRFAAREVAGEAPYPKQWRLGLTYGEEF